MKRMTTTLFAVCASILIAIGFGAPATADIFLDPQFDVQVTSNIVYGTGEVGFGTPSGVSNMDLLMDLYQPIGAGLPTQLPGIVLIHGGGFTTGSKAGMSSLASDFASRGYVAKLD